MKRLELALLPKGELRSLSQQQQPPETNDVTHLTDLYESYASLFPNPHLIQEQQESNKLLQALSAASQVQVESQKQSSSGLFRFLWGAPNPVRSTTTTNNNNKNDATIMNDSKLSYQLPENDCDSLLGTDSLETSCIPMEAHAAARLYLTSSRAHEPIVVRTAWERPGVSVLTIPDWGILVEAANNDNTAVLQYTSDREALLRRKVNQPLSLVRASSVGPNLLAVSWGFTDGVVIIYRRLVSGHSGKHWQAVASVSPSPEVLDQLGEDEDYLKESSLLRVTDIVPLVVEQVDQIPAVTLAISRLSGFIELVPLPHAMWYGPELSVPPSRRKDKIPTLNHCIVLSTGAYHVDIMALDVFRTSVEEDTVWDEERYPHSPPAEHVLAATGSSEENHQVVTFWSISTVLGSSEASSIIGFSLVAQLAEAWDVGKAGPDISIMATRGIMRHWRKSRKVELRDDTELDERQNEIQVTTLSLPAPVVSMRFLCETDCIRLALLDWNSGVTILDCDLLERSVSQCLSTDEYNAVHAEAEILAPLVKVINNRGSVLESMPIDPPPTIVSVEWPSRALLSQSTSRMDSCIMALSSRPPALHVAPIGSDSSVQYTSLDLSSSPVSRLHRLQSSGRFSIISTRLMRTSNGNAKDVFFAKLAPLDPKEIVRALAQESKMQEAIAIYLSISKEDQQAAEDTIEECRRQLWKSHQDVSYLEAIKDAEYVFQQALHFGESQMGDEDEFAMFEQYRRVHHISLAKLLEKEQNSATSEQIHVIRERLIMAGTYELLCTYMGVPMLFQRFQQDLLQVSSLELAISFAQTSDLAALSVICCRHRGNCLDSFTVLDQIPLTVPVEDYQHLLPVTKEGGVFFLADNDSFVNIERMPAYLYDRFGINCILGNEDAKLVLEHTMFDQASKEENETKVEEWYFGRANDIRSFLSTISDLTSFTRLSLIALGSDKETVRSPVADQLIALHQRYQIMLEMALDGEYNGSFVQGFNELYALDCMAVGDLLRFVLEGHNDPDQIFRRFHEYFLPLAEQHIAADEDFAKEVSNAVCTFCHNAARDCGSVSALRHVVSVCSTFVSFSRSSIHKETRIIKEKELVMDVVLAVSDTVMDLGSRVITSENDMRYIIHGLWTMYESLPVRGSLTEAGGDSTGLSDLADYLFQDLVAVEICTRWLGPDAFSLVLERRRNRQSVSFMDAEIVANICEAFCIRISSIEHGTGEDLLSHLVADIMSLNKNAFQNDIDLRKCISNSLLCPLLQSGQIHLLAECISISDREWLDFDRLNEDISLFVNDAVFSEGENASTGGVSAAISCQELLSRSLPGIDFIFREVRQCLDAAHFINTVILSASKQVISPAEVRRLNGEDLADLLLERDPFIAVLHDEKWKDSSWSKTANALIRASTSGWHFPQDSPVPVTEEPSPPGQAMLHLAKILDLQPVGVYTIRIKMAHLCTQKAMDGAAAAICRSILVDRAMLTPVQTNRLLGVLVDLISNKQYTDLETKRELCTLTLALKQCDLSIDSSAQLMHIVGASTHFEYEHLSSYRVINPLPSLQRLCRDTSEEYAVDLVDLFSSLYSQSDMSTVDDELLNTIGRYAAFWCIAQCTRPKRGDPVPFDISCITFNLLLSSFIFLHMHNSTLRSTCFEEINSIFADQKASAVNLSLPNLAVEWVKPAKSIVQRLTNRGYSQNGALRATSMTQNRGYNDALQWAVTHSLDKNFDDPILLLRKHDQVYVLKEGLTIMHVGLSELLPSLTNENNRASIFKDMGADADFLSNLDEPHYFTRNSSSTHRKPSAGNGQKTKATGSSEQLCVVEQYIEAVRENNAIGIDHGAANGPMNSIDSVMESTVPIKQEDAPEQQHLEVLVEQNFTLAEPPSLDVPAPPRRSTLSARSPPPPPSRGHSSPPIPLSASVTHSGSTRVHPTPPPPRQVLAPPPPPRPAPHATHSVPPTAPPIPPPPNGTDLLQTPKRKEELSAVVLTPKTRSVMLKRGEVLLKTSKAASPDLQPNDRQRLIEQGRRLLQQSRKKAFDATPSTQQHRYSLRSKGSPKALFNGTLNIPMTMTEAVQSSNDVLTSTTDIKHVKSASIPQADDSFGWDFDDDAGSAPEEEDVKSTGWDFDEGDL